MMMMIAGEHHSSPLVWIAGGENALINKYPYQVSLEHKARHKCGASILNNNTIVTAAHCVFQREIDDLMVRAGSSLVEQRGSMHRVEKVDIHEKFLKTGQLYENDVALVYLQDEIAFDEKRQAIRLFPKGEKPSPGDEAEVTGWGSSTSENSPVTQLQVVKVTVIDTTVCNETYRSTQGISLPEGQICAGESGKGSCWGDDGGPLAIQGRLTGIVSWGDACKKAANPGVYTSIGFFKTWIDDKMNP